VSLLGNLLALEVDVTESTRPARLLVCDYASGDEALVGGELLVERIVVNVPGEVTNPEGAGSLGLLSLGLLSGGLLLLFGIALSLALVGRSLGLGLLLLGAGILIIIVRIRRVIIL